MIQPCVGEGDAQIIRGMCPSREYRLWGNLSALTDNGQWLAAQVVLLEGKNWQINPDPGKLESDCKLWMFDKPLCDLEWDPLELCWQKRGTTKLEKFFENSTKLGRQIIGSKSMGATQTRNTLGIKAYLMNC